MRSLSVIIPVYNGAATIARAIDSALSQQVDRPMEVVVVNDGSTDSTATILEGYGSKLKVVTQPNRGPAAARNAGVRASNGAYLAFLDADDEWLPGHLAKTCAALDSNPTVVLAFTDIVWTQPEERRAEVLRSGFAPTMEDLLRGAWLAPSTAVMRRATFEACGGFREEFRAYEDTCMWLLARERGEFAYVPEPTVVYRGASLAEHAWKYSPSLPAFMRLVRRRYGAAAEPLIAHKISHYAPGLLQMALSRIESGDLRGAAGALWMLMRVKPSYFLNSDLLARLFRRKNFVRLMRAFVGSCSKLATRLPEAQ